MKTPFNEDDYFKGSTMSFGDHLEELRQALIKSIYALAIGILIGMAYAPTIVSLLKGPIEKALEKYYREKATLELTKRLGDEAPIEMLNLIEDREMVPEFIQIELSELQQNLDMLYPGQFDQLHFSPYSFQPEDFHVLYFPVEWFGTVRSHRWRTVAFCQRLVTQAKVAEDSVEAEVWGLLSVETQQHIEKLTAQQESAITLEDRRTLAKGLNACLEQESLSNSDAMQAVKGTGKMATTIATLREESNKEKLSSNSQRRLNKLLLSAHFVDDLSTPQLTLVDVPVWKKVKIRVQSLNAQEAFMIWMKASFISGLLIASPWIFVQIWLFVAAGLYPHEKKYVYLYLPISLGLFLSGALLAFGFVFEPVLNFLFWFNQQMDIDPDPRIGEWLGFVLLLPLAFGISFQLPLVMFFLNRVGVVSVDVYIEHWRVALLIIAVASMIITPGGDPYSLLLMMVPLVGLYFLGIAMCRWLPKGRNPFSEVYEP
jgi:sec-independent protein translocase protein TatC